MCFEKVGDDNLEVHFEIIREDEQLPHVGREDLGKLTRRIGSFLIEIRKTGLEYK